MARHTACFSLLLAVAFVFASCEREPGELVLVPAGAFLMGQDGVAEPIHQVTLTHDFYMGVYEVTNEEYRAAVQWAYNQGYVIATTNSVMGHGVELLDLDAPSCEIAFHDGVFSLSKARTREVQNAYPSGYDPADHPVKEVSWYGAACYCDWLSEMEELTPFYGGNWVQTAGHNPFTSQAYRLPTEAEWEYAAQFNECRTFPWGEEWPECRHANFDESGMSNYCVGWTTPVGRYPQGESRLGLMDLSGNLSEWVGDLFSADYYGYSPGSNPLGPARGTIHIGRGGGWHQDAHSLGCTYRDTSEGRVFTLTDHTRQVLADLSDPIIVRAYLSRNLGLYDSHRQYIIDKLAEYRDYSRGRFSFDIFDPSLDEQVKREAADYGVESIQMQTLEFDILDVREIWLGLVLMCGNRHETIPSIQQLDDLEQDLTSLTHLLATSETRRIGILQGHGEPTLDQHLTYLDEILSKNYHLEPIDLTKEQHVDSSLQALLLISPTETYGPGSLALLDAYFMSGVRLGIFTNSVTADIQTQQGAPREHGLGDLLTGWGVNIKQNLVQDKQCGMVQVRQGGQALMALFPVSMQYAFFPRVTGFSSAMSISEGIEAAQLFYPSSLDTSLVTVADVRIEPFAWSSPHTHVVKDRFQLGIKQEYTLSDFPDNRQLFGVACSGHFPAGQYDADLFDSLDLDPPAVSSENRLVVFGDGYFVQDEYLGQQQLANLRLAENIVEWLVHGSYSPSYENSGIGFRVCRTANP